MNSRSGTRLRFLDHYSWGDAQVEALIPDASFRQYFRVTLANQKAILMDAPPEHEPIDPFLKLTQHLKSIELRVPEILAFDARDGFILLEDLGDNTFTELIVSGENELLLYEKALGELIKLQSSAKAVDIDVGEYDFDLMIDEACLFTQWYLPAVTQNKIDKYMVSGFNAAWKTIFKTLPEINPTLVLRDFHVDNLMMINDQCALLDYQDAVIGSPAYDVVSLLEDARRDIGCELTQKILSIYQDKTNSDPKIFQHHYVIWGAQRHCKVAGIFMRLWVRDNKPNYLIHLTRVMALLKKNLQCPELKPLAQWFDQHNVSTSHQKPNRSREDLMALVND